VRLSEFAFGRGCDQRLLGWANLTLSAMGSGQAVDWCRGDGGRSTGRSKWCWARGPQPRYCTDPTSPSSRRCSPCPRASFARRFELVLRNVRRPGLPLRRRCRVDRPRACSRTTFGVCTASERGPMLSLPHLAANTSPRLWAGPGRGVSTSFQTLAHGPRPRPSSGRQKTAPTRVRRLRHMASVADPRDFGTSPRPQRHATVCNVLQPQLLFPRHLRGPYQLQRNR